MFASLFARNTPHPVSRTLTVRLSSHFTQPVLRIGSQAPNFTAKSTAGPLHFHKFLNNKWTVLFSHPADFTPVCTTELGAFAKRANEFAQLNTQLIGLSTDPVSEHKEWIKDIESISGVEVKYPIIADTERKVSFLYNMVDQQGFENLGSATAIRNVFVIDPAKSIRLMLVYPASVGRNMDEILRCVRALQTADERQVATPVNWVPGDDVIVPPSVSTEDAKIKFGCVREVRPYLRYVK